MSSRFFIKLCTVLILLASICGLSACEVAEPRQWSCTPGDPDACTGGWACHPDTQPARCGPKRAAGEACVADSQCTGICLTSRNECGETQPAGSLCERRQECQGTELDCQPGIDGRRRCVVALANGRCDDDNVCPAGKVCRAAAEGITRTCLPGARSGEYCDGHDNHCGQGLVCGMATAQHQATCGIPLGRSCDTSGAESCVAGAGCYGDVCRSKRTYAQSCEALDQCTPRPPYMAVCSFDAQGRGTCTLPSGGLAPADGSLACPPGHVARPDETGVTRCITPGGPHSSCAPDRGTQCTMGLECLPGDLDRPSGWACLVSLGRDCVSNPGACQDGAVCRPTSAGAPATRSCQRIGQVADACTMDAHCAPSLVCSTTHQCKVRDSGSCEQSSDCLGGRYCIVAGSRAECRPPGGLNSPCQAADHCATNLTCDFEQGLNQCRLVDGAYCGDAPRGCRIGWTCYSNICRKLQGTDEPCSADALCISGFCAPGLGKCKAAPLSRGSACVAAGDCASKDCTGGHCN